MNFGIIFDLDGVIIDSSAYHMNAWELLAEEESYILPPDHFKNGFGMKSEHIIISILQWTFERDEIDRLSKRKESIYRDILRKNGIRPLDGVIDYLQLLSSMGVPCALATSAKKETIALALEITGLHEYFTAIITGDDVENGKPHPSLFFMAADAINREPQTCVVVEDGPAGISAAHAAGMKVVGVTTTRSAKQLGAADVVVSSISDLDFMSLRELADTCEHCRREY